MKLLDDEAIEFKQGQYKYKAVVVTGPILIQSKAEGEAAYSTVTDGSIAATEDKLMSISEGESIKVQLAASDEFYISIVESGAF